MTPLATLPPYIWIYDGRHTKKKARFYFMLDAAMTAPQAVHPRASISTGQLATTGEPPAAVYCGSLVDAEHGR